MDRKKNRSDRYQNLFNEQAFSHEMMADLPESAGLTGYLNDAKYNDDLLDLREELRLEFWRLVDAELTPRQREVLHLYANGYTQMEIAKILGVNQSSITKSINGNCDYRSGKKVYGGASKKLKRLISRDSKIQTILAKISELEENDE